MSEQSKLGQELNRIMQETGLTALQTMSAYLEVRSLKIGRHVFASKAKAKEQE